MNEITLVLNFAVTTKPWVLGLLQVSPSHVKSRSVKTDDENMDAHNSWESLPSIIIVEILSYLDLTDRLNATISCRRWRTCLFQAKLWQSVDFKLKYGKRKSSRFLSEICGRFVREATVEFTSQNVQDLKESVRLLEVFGRNSNIERLVLKPSSCLIAWPERHSDRMCERWGC